MKQRPVRLQGGPHAEQGGTKMICWTMAMGKRRRGSLLVFGTLVLLVLSVFLFAGACGSLRGGEPQAVELKPVTVYEAVHSVLYAPFYVALSQGFFQEEGLEIKLVTAGGSDRAARALLTGMAEVALAGPEPALYLHRESGEAPLRILGQLVGRDGSYLLARGPVSQFSWQQVRRQTIIGGRPGGMPEMVLEYVLRREGIKPHDEVEIVTDLDPIRAAAAFKEGQGDFILLFEPEASLFEKEGTGFMAAAMAEAGGPLPYTVLLAAGTLVDQDPETVQSVVNASYRGLQWIANHDAAETGAVLAAYFPETPADVLVRLVDRYRQGGVWPSVSALAPDQLTRLQEIMAIGGVLGRGVRIDFQQLVDERFLRQTLRNPAAPSPGGD